MTERWVYDMNEPSCMYQSPLLSHHLSGRWFNRENTSLSRLLFYQISCASSVDCIKRSVWEKRWMTRILRDSCGIVSSNVRSYLCTILERTHFQVEPEIMSSCFCREVRWELAILLSHTSQVIMLSNVWLRADTCRVDWISLTKCGAHMTLGPFTPWKCKTRLFTACPHGKRRKCRQRWERILVSLFQFIIL